MSLALVGAAIGALFAGVLSDKIGRKKVILLADAIFSAGALTMAFAPQIWVLMLGRVIIGLGVGIASQAVPLYLSEVSPVEIRGRIVTANIGALVFGQLMSSVLVLSIAPDWRVMLGVGAVPSTLQFIGMLFLPESPRWLGKEGLSYEQEKVM